MIVIYKSKTGFTEKYAKKIAKKLNCDAINIKYISKIDISKQDIVIYGSRVHAGMIDGLNKIKKLLKNGTIKNLVIFATGGTPNKAEELIDKLWKNNLNEEELKTIPHFYMQSGICYEKMGVVDRLIMKMAGKMMKKKENKDNNEIGFVQAISESYDISSDEYIKPLLAFLKMSYKTDKLQ